MTASRPSAIGDPECPLALYTRMDSNHGASESGAQFARYG